jgi:hypothetical protein
MNSGGVIAAWGRAFIFVAGCKMIKTAVMLLHILLIHFKFNF